jgi:glutamate synthase (NADPH/NADH) small chain
MNDVDGRAVDIGRLQGFATAPIIDAGTQLFEAAAATRNRIAVVGAGPAGLACAAELVRRGHEVIAFDAASSPGGLNTHGVADYKVPQAEAFAEIAWIEAGGVEIQGDTAIGADLGFDELLAEYDAVFVGVGLGEIRPLQISGEELEGVYDALEVIAAAKSGEMAPDAFTGLTVAVVGGGNTAIDAARLAPRLGAERVMVLYRRAAEHMPAYRHEVEEAVAEGVQFTYWLAPESIEGDERVTGIRCRLTTPGEPGPDGRPSVVLADDSIVIACDFVIAATGQEPHGTFLGDSAGLELDRSGRVVVDDGYRTSNPAVWAGGDCVNGGKEVVNAVAEGMAAARSIDSALRERR